ncbi:MAG: DUF6132 family protein [Chitinophagaceae bacterium]
MNKSLQEFLCTYKLIITGAALGSIFGFLYYYYIGCKTGACMITSKPLNSTLYGAVLGGLLLSIFKKNK